MSAYEQRAREWLESWFSFGQAPNDRVVEGLIAFAESIAAEARGQAIEEAALVVEAAAVQTGCSIRALAPRPDLRLVAREDLAVAIGWAMRLRAFMDGADTAAIDRLRAGEEGT